MPGARELEARVVRDAREGEAQIPSKTPRRRAHVGTRERVDRADHARQRIADARGQTCVDRDFLALHLRLEDLEPVAHWNHRARLDEERRAARARRVDDPREALVRIGAHGHHVPPLTLGDVAILEDPLVLPHEVVEPRQHARARRLVLRAELLQARARAIRQRAVGIERLRKLVRESVECRVGRAGFEERRRLGAARRQEPAQHARGAERLADLPNFLGREHTRRAHAADRRRHVGELDHGKGLTRDEELRRLARLSEQAASLGRRRREGQIEREPAPHVRDAPRRERFEQTVPLEIASRLVGAGIS